MSDSVVLHDGLQREVEWIEDVVDCIEVDVVSARAEAETRGVAENQIWMEWIERVKVLKGLYVSSDVFLDKYLKSFLSLRYYGFTSPKKRVTRDEVEVIKRKCKELKEIVFLNKMYGH